VFFAPAMDLDMYRHPATRESIRKLQATGNHLIPPNSGELASGLEGEGRMSEPAEIVEILREFLRRSMPFAGKKFLITAGPTQEAIDPVRYIGNHSTGQMGYELADAAAQLGAEVTLVSGPSVLGTDREGVQVIPVVSAREMYRASMEVYEDKDVVICAAAVADFRPKTTASQKIKKDASEMSLTLVRNPDILESMGKAKKNQFLVGFALETEKEQENATAKLRKKNLDAIVLNSLRDAGAGFGKNTNKITFIDKNLVIKPFEVKTKAEVARDILHEISERLHE